MAAFAVLSVAPNPTLAGNVAAAYPNDNYVFSPSTWFVIDQNITTAQVCEKVGIGPGKITMAMVVRFESYFGHASTALWEWLKLKGATP